MRPRRRCSCDRQRVPRRRARVSGLCGFRGTVERVPAKYQKTGRCASVQERCKNEKGDKMSTEFYCEEFPAEQNGRQVQTLKDLLEAYPEDRFWQTTLIEGSVMIARGEEKVLMKPDEQYQINLKTGKGELKEVLPELYTSWRDGKFYFKAYTFEELVGKLERWYDFTMFYTSESIKNRRFSGVINKHEPLQDMLKFLEMTSDVQFNIKGNVVTASLKNNK